MQNQKQQLLCHPRFSALQIVSLFFFSCDRIFVSLFFALIGRRDFFGFGCTIFALADCIFSTFLFFILFSRTIPILPKGTSYQSLSKVQLRPHSLFTTIFFFFYLYHCYYIVKSVNFQSLRLFRLLVSQKHIGQTQSVGKKGSFFCQPRANFPRKISRKT